MAVTPCGKPFAPETPALEMPVAPVVVWVILAKAVLIHNVGDADAALAVLAEVTVITPVAFAFPHPPDKGIV